MVSSESPWQGLFGYLWVTWEVRGRQQKSLSAGDGDRSGISPHFWVFNQGFHQGFGHTSGFPPTTQTLDLDQTKAESGFSTLKIGGVLLPPPAAPTDTQPTN